MDYFRKLGIGARLTLGFGTLVLLMLVLATFSLSRLAAIENAMQAQNRVEEAKLAPLYAAREALAQTGLAARNAYIFTAEADAQRELDILDQQKAAYLAALEKMTPAFAGDVQFEKVRSGLLAMAEELKRPRAFRNAGKLEEYGRFLVNECSPLRRRIVADIEVTVRAVEKELALANHAAEAEYRAAVKSIIAEAAFTLVVCIAIAWLITRQLLRQLGGEPAHAAHIADRIAQGELALAINVRDGDDGSLLFDIRAMRDRLASIVGQVRSRSDTMASGTAEIAAGNRELSVRTEHQADALSRIAVAMEELTNTVKQNAGNADQANALALSASQVSEEGGRVVERVVVTMDSIRESSRRIVDIISVIDGIAFQTNILALNAAVEAARAGEQGRGFAVVASEVRNLAQRSAAAAREIKSLIDDSVDKVRSGSELVEEAGGTMTKVVDSVRQVTAIMGEISSASREQSVRIDQVNTEIAEMDELTRQNAGLVEEAAAAAQALQDQAAALADMVGIFKLAPAPGAQRLAFAAAHAPLRIAASA